MLKYSIERNVSYFQALNLKCLKEICNFSSRFVQQQLLQNIKLEMETFLILQKGSIQNMKIERYDIVQHFKRELVTEEERNKGVYLYQILEICKHTETGETLIVYKALYNYGNVHKGDVFARPIDMFFSRVDKEKYPYIKQEQRFETVASADKEISEWKKGRDD